MKDFSYYLNKIGEIGFVTSAAKSICMVDGLPEVKPGEIVLFEEGGLGQAMFLYKDAVEVLLLSDTLVRPASKVARTKERLTVPAGEELLGRVVNSLGEPISHYMALPKPPERRAIEMSAPGIEKRVAVKRPLETGVMIVDVLVPMGRGQRELVVGDRKTGKTSFLLQTIVSQARQGTICLYTAIGKKRTEIKQIEEFFADNKVLEKITIIASSAEDPAGLIYLTPYSAITVAEYFRDKGQDVLLILDDLTTHAKFYREIALSAKRFPGRDSYPVDIFFTHAGILEKGGNFKTDNGEAAITILPIAETNQGDLSGYIQTNLMSMTDGHIYFDKDLFVAGQRPAVNPFLSVTRVGKQAQTPLLRSLSLSLLSFLTNYERLKSFVHFGAELTPDVKEKLIKGEKIFAFFEQKKETFIPLTIAVFLLALLWQDKRKEGEWKVENGKLIEKYQKDKGFREKIDALIGGAKDFEELLGRVDRIKVE